LIRIFYVPEHKPAIDAAWISTSRNAVQQNLRYRDSFSPPLRTGDSASACCYLVIF
jgi:hypothetical protein